MSFLATLGQRFVEGWQKFCRTCSYLGEVLASFGTLLRHPRYFRVKDFVRIFRRASYDGLPIAIGIGLLLGVILAFESAAALRMFGVEVYVADLLAIGLFRELGPLVTAIVLAGRSGSAFAAEIGTMKVDEELDALTTMGLPPVPFLVPPRLFAAVFAMPILTILAEFAGLIGGGAVLAMVDVPSVVYWTHVTDSTSLFNIAFGLVKSCLFGFLVAMIGCQAGLETGRTADGVGVAATTAVVKGIVAIAVADGILAVLCYVWGL